MRQPEENFFKSTLHKVLFLISEYTEQRKLRDWGNAKSEASSSDRKVKSMKQMRSMIGGA